MKKYVVYEIYLNLSSDVICKKLYASSDKEKALEYLKNMGIKNFRDYILFEIHAYRSNILHEGKMQVMS